MKISANRATLCSSGDTLGGRFGRSRWTARVWRTKPGFLAGAVGMVVVITH
ncbi:MAG: hypothetical protein IPP10_15910 [Candidatus Competibacteraceae bacterium]|nr:hypothetical protein [Candidatus Competibacteraceae bacterium]